MLCVSKREKKTFSANIFFVYVLDNTITAKHLKIK